LAAQAQGLPLKILDINADKARDPYGADFVPVRPDQIVAWGETSLPMPCARYSRLQGTSKCVMGNGERHVRFVPKAEVDDFGRHSH
jgi:hypothetical protein